MDRRQSGWINRGKQGQELFWSNVASFNCSITNVRYDPKAARIEVTIAPTLERKQQLKWASPWVSAGKKPSLRGEPKKGGGTFRLEGFTAPCTVHVSVEVIEVDIQTRPGVIQIGGNYQSTLETHRKKTSTPNHATMFFQMA